MTRTMSIAIVSFLLVGMYFAFLPQMRESSQDIGYTLSNNGTESTTPGWEKDGTLTVLTGASVEYDLVILNNLGTHANMRHGIEADMARECSSGNYSLHIFKNPDTRRVAYVCDLGGLWGIHIIDELGNEITSFLKNKMRTFDQVLKYMRNSGYELLH